MKKIFIFILVFAFLLASLIFTGFLMEQNKDTKILDGKKLDALKKEITIKDIEKKQKQEHDFNRNEKIVHESEKNQNIQQYERKKLSKIKGVWLMLMSPQEFSSALKEMKDLGANIIGVSVPYCIRNKKIEPSFMPWLMFQTQEEFFIDLIKKLHKNGFAVFLELNTMDPFCEIEIKNKDWFIKNFYEESKKWAKIAEEQKVEFFSPLNEPNIVLRGKESEWIDIVNIKDIFKGNIVIKIADVGSDINFAKFDYIAFDIFPNDVKEWKNQLEFALKRMKTFIKKYNLKGGFFGEIGASTIKRNDQLFAGSVFDESSQAKIFEIMFTYAWNKVDGFFILGWSYDATREFNFHNLKAEQIVKEYYKQH